MEFILIGDTVNVASRGQDMAKETPFTVLLAGATRDGLGVAPLGLQPLGALPIRGRSVPVELFGMESSVVGAESIR
jgi:adenylate cyclase